MTDKTNDLRLDNACKVAEEFTKLFYEAIDSKRHTLNRFYMDNATLSWDGNLYSGKDAIQKFLESLPGTEHGITSLDAQPVSIEAVKGQQTVLVQVAGSVDLTSNFTKGFTQNFVITAQDNKWKVFSDCFRLQAPISQSSANPVS